MNLTTYFRLVFKYKMYTALFPLLSSTFMCREQLLVLFIHKSTSSVSGTTSHDSLSMENRWRVKLPCQGVEKKVTAWNNHRSAWIFSYKHDTVQIRYHTYVSLSLWGTSVFYIFPKYRVTFFSPFNVRVIFWVFCSFFAKHYSYKMTKRLVTNLWCRFYE
jgi:hypothetical protein